MTLSNRLLLFLFYIIAGFFPALSAFSQTEFIQNKGQWDNSIDYRGDFSTGSFFLQQKGFTVGMSKAEDLARVSDWNHGVGVKDSFTFHSFVYNVTFLGAADHPKTNPEKPLATYNNYFIGNDRSKWASDCKIYNAVTYKNIYPNIDVRYYSVGGQLKYDFIVYPGGNPNAIALRYDGPLSLAVKNKDLLIGTSVGEVKELSPYTYQTGAAGRSDVPNKFILKDNVVTFDIGDYDPQSTLVIDPQLIFVSFTGSTSDNWGYTATPGPDGSFYAGGIVFGGGFKVSPGAYQTVFHGGGVYEDYFPGVDIAIFKFSPNGGARVYATYLGGSQSEQPHSMIVDAQGDLIVAGRTNSTDYPVQGILGSVHQGSNYDIVVTKFNPAGTALLGSVKIGGTGDDGVNIRPKYIKPFGVDRLRQNYGDDARSEVILDASNNIYLASCTQSADFPIAFASQSTLSGSQDGVIMKFTPDLSSLLFSTYFGGSGDDACFVAAINPVSGNLYVGGATTSAVLPGNTGGVLHAGSQGGIDGFVTELTPAGISVKTSFFGTAGIDLVYGLKFDKLGYPYIMGTSTGGWPVMNAAYSNPGAKQFIAKLKPDLSAFLYSTVFGTNSAKPNISPVAFLVDRCENVYVSGWGGGINSATDELYLQGNTNGMPEVNPLSGIPPADGEDFYFFVLKKDAQSQLFGSHFGQFGGFGDHVDGGTSRFDANGIIYQAICANCGGTQAPRVFFPTTAGTWAQINGSSACNEAAVKIEMNFSGVGAEIQSAIMGNTLDTLGCIPLTVDFKDLLHKGVTYYWNFNSAVNPNAVDQVTTVPQTTFTFTTTGTYRVRLIAEDLSTCNQRDTSYINIKAGNNPATPKFTKKKRTPCTSTTYDFTNLSIPGGTSSFGPQSFVWNFGDGTLPLTTGSAPVSHTYPGPGTYFITLTIIDTAFCNSPDSIIDTLRLNSQVKAIPLLPVLGCAPFSAHFRNNSTGGLSWLWDFGDPASGPLNSSTDFEPVHVYQNPGTYKYRLIAYDSTTCNKIDTSAYFTVTVVQKPQANGDWAPNPPQANVPVRFSNSSLFSDSYLWNFGDGESSAETAPTHEYNATGAYNAELIAYSKAGCTDTFNLVVNVIIFPLLDVPNAFTPGRFGVNGTVNVRGFGIAKMDWRIYNRWGQMVFRSGSKREGWNGFYKGKLQPTDVYGYTLDVEFTDGTKERKTGDITLLR